MPRTRRQRRVGRRPRRLPIQVRPTRIEEQYAAALVRLLLGAMRASYARLLGEVPGLIARRAERRDSPESERVRGLVAQAAATLRSKISRADVERLARQFAKRTETYQRVQLSRQVRHALGADPLIRDAGLASRVEDFVRENVALISRIPQALHGDVEAMVHRAVVAARPAQDLAEEVEERFGVAERHARLIARDQIGKLYADVNHERQRDLGVTRFVWRTVQDERVRGDPDGLYPKALPSHYALEGLEFSYDDPPQPEGADEPLLPGQDYQCLPGDARVLSEAPVLKLHRRWYSGECAVLTTDSGEVLRITPNHPILTIRGWLAAQDVQVGDHVIQASAKRFDVCVTNGEHTDASIENIFRALAPLGTSKHHIAARRGFHGDAAIDEEVEIVDVHRCLVLERDLERFQPILEEILARADESTLGGGHAYLSIFGFQHASNRIMRGASQLLSLLLGGGAHAQEHRLRAVAWIDAATNQLSADGRAIDVEVLRQALHTPAVGVELHHRVAVVILGVVRRTVMKVSRRNTASAETLAQYVASDTENRGCLGDGVLSQQLTRVVEKSVGVYAGHVYNMETESGWYVAQNLIVRNCRCFAEPILEDLDQEEEPDEGEEQTSGVSALGAAEAALLTGGEEPEPYDPEDDVEYGGLGDLPDEEEPDIGEDLVE